MSSETGPTGQSEILLSFDYPTPGDLQRVGPLIHGGWRVPEARSRALARGGKPVPDEIEGYFLLDTGATLTCIDHDVARTLGLDRIGFRESYGASGRQPRPIFAATWFTRVGRTGENQHLIVREGSVAAVPDLEKCFQDLKILANGAPARVIGLVGRDFLRLCTFTYLGTQGQLRLEVHAADAGGVHLAPDDGAS